MVLKSTHLGEQLLFLKFASFLFLLTVIPFHIIIDLLSFWIRNIVMSTHQNEQVQLPSILSA